MRRGAASAFFGMTISSTPCLPVALICSASAVSGRAKRRWKLPCTRSTRVNLPSLGPGFRAALAFQGEHALVHVDLDVLGIDAGDVGSDDEALRFFADVDARLPLAGHDIALVFGLGREKLVEDLLHAVVEAAELGWLV
jgi:hypothetical protein